MENGGDDGGDSNTQKTGETEDRSIKVSLRPLKNKEKSL